MQYTKLYELIQFTAVTVQEGPARYLPPATIITLPRKNASYHLVILRGHLWGGRFQVALIGERQVAGGNGRNPSGQEGYISSEYGRFLAR
jgi:hypothetical protein